MDNVDKRASHVAGEHTTNKYLPIPKKSAGRVEWSHSMTSNHGAVRPQHSPMVADGLRIGLGPRRG